MRQRVIRAMERQRLRQSVFNSMLSPREVARHCAIDEESRKMLARAVNQFALSARAYDRILRLARTIADLSGAEAIDSDHLGEALRYRVGRTQR